MNFSSLLLVVLACCSSACASDGTSQIDFDKVDAAGDAVLNQLDAQIQLRADDPDKAEELIAIRKVASDLDLAVDAVIEGGGTIEDVSDLLDIATNMLNTLRENTDPEDTSMIATIAAIQGGLDIIKIILA